MHLVSFGTTRAEDGKRFRPWDGPGGKLCLVPVSGACSGKCLGLGECTAAPGWKAAAGSGIAGTYALLSDPRQCLDVDAKARRLYPSA